MGHSNEQPTVVGELICENWFFGLRTLLRETLGETIHTKFEENCVKRFRDSYEWANFQVFSAPFHILEKNCCNSQICTPIQLKFGTSVGRLEAIISINFGENLCKILRVIIDHLRKTRVFRHTYSCWLHQPENRYVAIGSTSEGCLFMVRNEWSKRQQRYEVKYNLGKNCATNFRVKENHEF